MKNREQVHARAQQATVVRDAFAEALKYRDYLADAEAVAGIHKQLVEITQPVQPVVMAITDGHTESR